MPELNSYPGQLVFGLDIGTRSIVGTVGYKNGSMFYVVAQETREHTTRAMMDGQIHDIEKVGTTINEVKTALEERIGKKLSQVCIAAAGRVLETVSVHVKQEFEQEKTISSEDIFSLNSLGVEQAYEEFQHENHSGEKYYCVGYSAVHYYMNGYLIGNLVNHKAKVIEADLIATFLPDDVVDGLQKAVSIAGLEVLNLTLEPIAAIQLAIPENYRMLNIALVDVGAGTSDISITKDGSIIAYGMLPIAGDALSETIARHCLVEFTTAEKIKCGIMNDEVVEYDDIMLLPQKITREEVLAITEPVVEDMTAKVADKIIELNGGKTTSAVFVVGGGGKIEHYTAKLAQKLGIAPERVAIRGKEVMQSVEFLQEGIEKDSLLVTPIGICLNFYEQNNSFIYVSFNGRRVKLYDNNKLTIADAALAAEFPKESLFPKRGLELNFTVNEKSKIVRGFLGEAAELMLNGEKADIYTPIHANDIIVVHESTAGRNAECEIRNLAEYGAQLQVLVNKKAVSLPKAVYVNDVLQNEYYAIKDQDRITISNYYTIEQILRFMDLQHDERIQYYVNNEIADDMTKVYENFSVTWEERQDDPEPEVETSQDHKMNQTHNVNQIPEHDNVHLAHGEDQLNAEDFFVIVNGRPVRLSGKSNYVFVDIFDHIDFDLTKVKGSGLVTNKNGIQAQYMEPLQSGDIIELYWKE
ncbi:MAG: cell division FtsA domain-containing protein [Lachnospiraceae bacterium]|nr:cell division FtsA domain-containing protein [Lachnospiraceae bacterium]MDD3659154.1 cell division FtsA domain-containing protein [Lachnospiraceae bacterium]